MPTKQQPPVKRAGKPPVQTNPRQREEEPPQATNVPVDKVSLYPVEAAIWQNYSRDGRSMYSVSFQRSYKDNAGEWHRTSSFSGSDLLVLAACAQQAYLKIDRLRKQDRENMPQPEARGNGRVTEEDIPF